MDVTPSLIARIRIGLHGLLMLALLLCLGTAQLHAQSDLGSTRGTVKDESGAAVPGASIEVTSVDSGQVRTAVSDAQGNFSVLSLERGSYKAKATMAGFEQETVSFDLQVSQVKALDFQLKIGAASQSIEVTSAAPLVD